MSSQERRDAITADATTLTPLIEARAKSAPRAQCAASVGPYLNSTRDLFDRWPVLSYEELRTRLGDILVVQETLGRQIDTVLKGEPDERATCLKAALLVNRALEEAAMRVKDWDFINSVKELIGEPPQSTPPKLLSSTSTKLDQAERKIASLGPTVTPGPWSVSIPRTQGEVTDSIYGVFLGVVCGQNSDIGVYAEPCGNINEVLIDGVREDEEATLYDAVHTLSEAYQDGSLSS